MKLWYKTGKTKIKTKWSLSTTEEGKERVPIIILVFKCIVGTVVDFGGYSKIPAIFC